VRPRLAPITLHLRGPREPGDLTVAMVSTAVEPGAGGGEAPAGRPGSLYPVGIPTLERRTLCYKIQAVGRGQLGSRSIILAEMECAIMIYIMPGCGRIDS
jgi:hypothetical protein